MQEKEDQRIFWSVTICSATLVILVIIGALIMRPDVPNFGNAIFRSVSIITHTYPGTGAKAPIFFLLSLMGSLLYIFIIYILSLLIFRGRLTDAMREVTIMRKVRTMSNHVIICGGGRVGGSVAEELKKRAVPYVIIERDEGIAHSLKKEHPIVIDDALTKEALINVNIGKAKSLVSCLGHDGDNVVQVLLARELNKDIQIVARANFPAVISRLTLVGATQIILPEKIGGQRMAELIVP